MEKRISSDILRDVIIEANPEAAFWLEENPDADLLESNAIDSINIIQVIGILEDRFGFVFDVKDLKVEHFRTLDKLLDMLARKYGFTTL